MTRESDAAGRDRPRKNAHRAGGNSRAANGMTSPPRVSRLDSLAHIRAELGRVYRTARRNEGHRLDSKAGLRLAMMLAQIRTAVEVEELEARLTALERRTESDVSR